MGTHALTDRKLKSLKPATDGRPYDVKDTEVRGLRIRVMTNTKTFVLLARFPGNKQPTRQSLGTYGEHSRLNKRAKKRALGAISSKGKVIPGPKKKGSGLRNSANAKTLSRLLRKSSSGGTSARPAKPPWLRGNCDASSFPAGETARSPILRSTTS